MKKHVLFLSMFAAFSANAMDVAISGDQTLIQDSGILSNSNFNLIKDKNGLLTGVQVSDILDSNLPYTFNFKIDSNYANVISYDKNAVLSPFESNYAILKFLENKEGEKVTYKTDDEEKEVELFKVAGNGFFLKDDDGKIFAADLKDIKFSEKLLNSQAFNLLVSFNKGIELKDDTKYHYNYFANGFNWTPNYKIILKDNNKLDFNFYGNISNNTKSDLNDVDLTLMIPTLNNPRPMYRNKSFNNMEEGIVMSAMAMDSAPMGGGNISSTSVEDLTAYKVEGKVDLKSGIASNVLIKSLNDTIFEKKNLIDLPTLNYKIVTAMKQNNQNKEPIYEDFLQGSKVTEITSTQAFIPYVDNKKFLKDYLPAGEIKIMKEIDLNGKTIVLPYSDSYLSGNKNDNIEIQLPKNKNVKYVAYLNKLKDITLIKQDRKNLLLNVKYTQRLENRGEKSETFVLRMDKSEYKNITTHSTDFKIKEFKSKNLVEMSVTLKPNEVKELFIERKELH